MNADPRAAALAEFGFSQRQANFLLLVILHAGVCVMRQYREYAGIEHGQAPRKFFAELVARGFATAYACERHNRGRIYHVHHKAFYRAIQEPNSRHRRATYVARALERLMLLDAVLAAPTLMWLATEREKVLHFVTTCGSRLQQPDLPSLTFGRAADTTVRYFPDKLPIGVEPDTSRHIFLYLITRSLPGDFRMFLQRHAEVFRALPLWSLRLLVPRHLVAAVPLYREAFLQELARPLAPALLDELRWYFHERHTSNRSAALPGGRRYQLAHQTFSAPRFRALYRAWQQQGDRAVYAARSLVISEAIERQSAQIEPYVLRHVYHHLLPLVGTS